MSNQSYVQKGKLTLLSLFAMAIGGLISCSSPVDNILRNTPVAPVGNQTFTINALRTNGDPVTVFTLAVTGPDTSFTTEFTATPVILSNVTTGDYTVEISQTGFIGQTKTRTLNVPDDASTDFEASMNVNITKVNDPVAVSAAASTVTVNPIGNGGTGAGSTATTVTIPAGAVQAGTTSISITPIPADPEAPDVDTNGTVVLSYDMQPTGTQFDVPIVLTIPLDVPVALVNAGVEYFFEYTYADGTQDIQPIVLSANGRTGTVSIDHFSTWKARSGFTISETNRQVTRSYIGECGADVSETYTRTGQLGGVYRAAYSLPASATNVSFSVNVSVNGVDLFQQTGTATQTVFDYTITNRSGNVVERGNAIPRRIGSATYSAAECHDSGG